MRFPIDLSRSPFQSVCRDRRVVERARVDNGRSFVLKMNANGISCSCSPLISDDQIAGPSSTPAKASDGTRIAFVEAAAARPRTDEEQDSHAGRAMSAGRFKNVAAGESGENQRLTTSGENGLTKKAIDLRTRGANHLF